MPPRRYVAFIFLLALLLALFVAQSSDNTFYTALAQSQSDSARVSQSPDDLQIQLVAVSDSPVGGAKKVGMPVTFTAIVVSGNPNGLTYFWNFGDGNTKEGRIAQNFYKKSGIYTAFVIATDGVYTRRATTIVEILVNDGTSVEAVKGLNGTSDSPTIVGNATNFFATVISGTNVIYEWDFGDSSPRVQGIAVSHVYARYGDYWVTVSATNENTPEPQKKGFWIWVLPSALTELTIDHTPLLVTVGTPIKFTASAKGSDPQFEWSFGDGEVDFGQQVEHTFLSIGSYEVRVRASNSVGEIFRSIRVIVRDNPPVILNILNNTPKNALETLALTAYVVSASPVTAHWNWGDGSSLVSVSDPAEDLLPVKELRVGHIYEDRGRYLVTLSVNNTGGSGTMETVIYIGVAPPKNNTIILYTPTSPRTNQPINFSVPLGSDGRNCTWEWGNGEVLLDTSVRVTYPYTVPGKYVVYVKCAPFNSNPDREIYDAERIVTVGGNFMLPLIAKNGQFLSLPSSGIAGAPTALPTATATPVEPTPTETMTPTFTETPTVTPTETPVATPTATETATITPIPVESPTATETPTETPTATETPTLIATAPETPTDTATPTLPAIETATETPTETPTIPGSTIPQITPTPTPLPLP